MMKFNLYGDYCKKYSLFFPILQLQQIFRNRKILVNFELSVSRKQKLLAAIYLEYIFAKNG